MRPVRNTQLLRTWYEVTQNLAHYHERIDPFLTDDFYYKQCGEIGKSFEQEEETKGRAD